MVANIRGKRLVQRFRRLLKDAAGDVDPGTAELGKSLAADQRIRILHAGNHAAYSGGDYCIGARCSAALVRAGFQVDIESCPASFFSGLFEGNDFRMLNTLVGVAPTGDDCALRVHNNGTYARIGRSQADSFPSQIERLAEEPLVGVAGRSHGRNIVSPQKHREANRPLYALRGGNAL